MSVLAADYKQQDRTNWVAGLSFHDLTLLRRVVRRVHLAYMPAGMAFQDRRTCWESMDSGWIDASQGNMSA